jgi:hypothetical protein
LNRSQLKSHRPLRLKGIPSQLYFKLAADGRQLAGLA